MTNLIKKEKDNEEIEIEGKILKITHLNKIFWPEEGYSKGDLINYYIKMSEYILPYLQNRPESLRRYPNGIKGKSFFQKNVDHVPPDWIPTVEIHSESGNDVTNYMICNNLPALVYMINLGCIDLNPWNSRTDKLDFPDYLIIDLDPEDIDFEYVVLTAQAVKKVLDRFEITSYPKTSGARGMHIYIPLGAKYSYDQCRNFAEILVNLIYKEAAQFTSLERSPSKRQGKVYLDYLQNARGQTLATPYSVRPRPKATVSTPLDWREVTEDLRPTDFTINNIFDRLKNKKDRFREVLGEGINIENVLKMIS